MIYLTIISASTSNLKRRRRGLATVVMWLRLDKCHWPPGFKCLTWPFFVNSNIQVLVVSHLSYFTADICECPSNSHWHVGLIACCMLSYSRFVFLQSLKYTVIYQTDNFYARQHICYSAYMLSPVRLSVRLSEGWIIEKQLKLWLWSFHRTVAPSL